ncbi:MAG: hypothetical protein HPY53_01470 [Brevinematales bacterium]|nr:hypothetical protein [Brevinematales bacterium]
MKILEGNEAVQGSTEWKEYRKMKFSASNAPYLFNMSPFCKYSDQSLYLAHLMRGLVVIKDNPRMSEGRITEPIVRKMVSKDLGIDFRPAVGNMDKDDRFMASFDGLNPSMDTVLEIKVSEHTFNYVKNNGTPPDHYMYQIQHQLLVSGAQKAYLAAYYDGEYELCEVLPDKKMMKDIEKAWLKFDKEYLSLSPEELPPLEKVITKQDYVILASQYVDIYRQKGMLEKQMDILKEKFVEIAGKEKITIPAGDYGDKIMVSFIPKVTVGYKEVLSKIAENNPDLAGEIEELKTLNTKTTDSHRIDVRLTDIKKSTAVKEEKQPERHLHKMAV